MRRGLFGLIRQHRTTSVVAAGYTLIFGPIVCLGIQAQLGINAVESGAKAPPEHLWMLHLSPGLAGIFLLGMLCSATAGIALLLAGFWMERAKLRKVGQRRDALKSRGCL